MSDTHNIADTAAGMDHDHAIEVLRDPENFTQAEVDAAVMATIKNTSEQNAEAGDQDELPVDAGEAVI